MTQLKKEMIFQIIIVNELSKHYPIKNEFNFINNHKVSLKKMVF